MDEGILIYAHNNELIDYARMAYCCALLAKHHLDRPVCLVTDCDTWDDFKTHRNRIDVFDHVEVIEEFNPRLSSRRTYGSRDNVYYHNRTRDMAYELTPFKKTLVLDSDYLVLDDRLKYVWELKQPMRANWTTVNISNPLTPVNQKLSDISIPLYWATVFYFDKASGRVNEFFERWKEVSKTWNFDYYSQLYNYRSAMYRNDFAFSVAEHSVGCCTDATPFCKPLPTPYILTAGNDDEIVDVHRSGFIMQTEGMLCKISSSFHCMNKVSLQNNLPKILELYE